MERSGKWEPVLPCSRSDLERVAGIRLLGETAATTEGLSGVEAKDTDGDEAAGTGREASDMDDGEEWGSESRGGSLLVIESMVADDEHGQFSVSAALAPPSSMVAVDTCLSPQIGRAHV